jgi:hypothetical protein
MAQGYSLHIGLNGVDPAGYNGWPGTLSGCLNDANAMQGICAGQGFTTQTLLNGDATANAILSAIGQCAYNLQSGDTFIISYSGHGSQVPDTTGTSPTGLDDTWVAYDRMLLGHELYNLWSQFSAGVRIEVYSDSCHSGTVIRELFQPTGEVKWPSSTRKVVPLFKADDGRQHFKQVFARAFKSQTRSMPVVSPGTRSRAMPPEIALAVFQRDQVMYEAMQRSRKRGDITGTVILISGCQDNQESQDGQMNGLFTEKLLAVWDSGNFSGTLPQFHQAIVALMPASQTPNYFSVGATDDVFANSRPLTIVDVRGTTQRPGTTAPSKSPSVVGPPGYSRLEADGPAFKVTLGDNPYYIFEITNDPVCFGNPDKRMDANFYASWDDPTAQARYTSSVYRMPSQAWNALKDSDILYYRVGTTTSADADHWDNYLTSTTDGDAAQAPSLTLTGAKIPIAPQPAVAASVATH